MDLSDRPSSARPDAARCRWQIGRVYGEVDPTRCPAHGEAVRADRICYACGSTNVRPGGLCQGSRDRDETTMLAGLWPAGR